MPAAAFTGGSVMDSCTAINRLPPPVYQALCVAAPEGSLHTCYDFAGVLVVRVPRVALVFDRNAATELDPSRIGS